MNLLMIAGDTSIVRGRRGAFFNTLGEFSTYWDQVDVLTPHVPGVDRYDCFQNVSLFPSPGPKLLHPTYVVRKGKALARSRRYDLIVSHDYGLHLNGLGAAALSRAVDVPYVSEIHHVDGYPRAANLRERMQPTLTRRYVRWASPRALAFRITNASQLQPLLQRWGVPAEKLLLLYSLYIDLGVFRPEPAKAEYDAMFVGRLSPNKNPLMFLEGAARAQDQLGDIRILIAGTGALRARLQRWVHRRGLHRHVIFKDWVDTPHELADLYRRARCLVCTSYSEGGPRVVAEALACGTPAISTRVGAAQELVCDGENGFLISWSPHELADRLVQLVSDEALHARLSAAAPTSVQQYEKSQVIRKYALAYQKLVDH